MSNPHEGETRPKDAASGYCGQTHQGQSQTISLPKERPPEFFEIARWARAQTEPGMSVEIHPSDDMLNYVLGSGRSQGVSWMEYFWLGREVVFMLEQTLRWLGKSFDDIKSFLDFASGYGRCTRFLLRAMPREVVCVADILPGAVEFQREHFKVRGLISDADPDAVEFDRSFDLISVISLFSHLPAPAFKRWLEKLTGALSPGGTMVFTTMRLDHRVGGDDNDAEPEFRFRAESESPILDPNVYGSTFCSRGFVDSLLRDMPGVSLLAYVKAGLNRHQDVYVIGKGVAQPAQPLVIRPHTRVMIDAAILKDGSNVDVVGWALDEDLGPVGKVRVYLDGEDAGEAMVGIERLDVAEHFGPPTTAKAGWSLRQRLSGKKPRWVVAVADSRQGSTEVTITELRDS